MVWVQVEDKFLATNEVRESPSTSWGPADSTYTTVATYDALQRCGSGSQAHGTEKSYAPRALAERILTWQEQALIARKRGKESFDEVQYGERSMRDKKGPTSEQSIQKCGSPRPGADAIGCAEEAVDWAIHEMRRLDEADGEMKELGHSIATTRSALYAMGYKNDSAGGNQE